MVLSKNLYGGRKLIKDILATARDLNLEVEKEDVEELLEMHNRGWTTDIVATAHDLNLEVEKEDVEELLEMHDRGLTTDIVATAHDLNLKVEEEDVKELLELHNRELTTDIVAIAGDLNLKVEEEDAEELLEMHHRGSTTDELKELFKLQCEYREIGISSEGGGGDKGKFTTPEIKSVLAKWEEVQNATMKWNPNKSEVTRNANLSNEKSMQLLKKRFGNEVEPNSPRPGFYKSICRRTLK